MPNHWDGNFFKTRFLVIGNISLNIKFGWLLFKNKKVVTLVYFIKKQHISKTSQVEIFMKQDL
jgi:hypothetical protein